jgi:hypothetical protein
MQLEHVISILEALANGVDPATDTEIPNDTFRSPEVIRALFTATAMLQRPDTSGRSSSDPAAAPRVRPAAAGSRWTDEEDAEVCLEYDAGVTFSDIARKHTRSTGAIMSRLVKLGRIEPDTLSPRLRERVQTAVQ